MFSRVRGSVYKTVYNVVDKVSGVSYWLTVLVAIYVTVLLHIIHQ